MIPRMRFRNYFLILILLNTTFNQCFKDCNIFQTTYSLVCSSTLRFMSKKSSEIFFNIIFLPAEFFSCLRFYHFTPLFRIMCMVKLSDNAISVKQPQKLLACRFKCHCCQLQPAVCLLNFRLANFVLYFVLFVLSLNFSLVNFGTSRHTSFYKLRSLSFNTGIDCILSISVYIRNILLILATNIYRKQN